MDTVLYILGLFVRTIPFILFCLLSTRINLKREERGHQFLLPILAVLFCIPTMLYTEQLAEFLLQLLLAISSLVTAIPYIGRALAQLLYSWYSSLSVGYGMQLLCNCVLMGLFCIVKRLALPIIRRFWSKWNWLYKKTSGHFYWEKGAGCMLFQRFGDMRRMFCAFYIAAIALGIVDLMLVIHNSGYQAFLIPFYPVFAVIVLGEIFFFLNGFTADEMDLPGDGEDEESAPECGEILEALKNTFGDRMGYADRRTAPPVSARSKVIDQLEEGDDLNRVTAAYFSSLEADAVEINPDYVAATDQLLHHESVVIMNPFYRDVTDYVLLPIFHELLNHHSVLVICGRTTNDEDVQNWLSDGIRGVTNLQKLWGIMPLERIPDENRYMDIGILGFGKLYDTELVAANHEFFKRTSLVILIEPSNLLGTGQMGLRNVIQFCEGGDTKPTFCIIDRNADGLVDALSHALRQSLVNVVASPAPKSGYCRAFWRAEGPGVQTRVLPQVSHYLGFGGELAVRAMRQGANSLHWYSGSKMPLIDLKWNVEQYFAPICSYLNIPCEQEKLDEKLHYHESLWQADFGPGTFVLAEDEFCNAFEMERAFGARIRQRGFVNILSESYMLRDYMHDKQKLFTNDPKAIPSIVPDYARTERNFVLRMLLMMSITPIEESVLSKELALHGNETVRPFVRFRDLVKKHTDLSPNKIKKKEGGSVNIGPTRVTKFLVSIEREDLKKVFGAALCPAYYTIENEQIGEFLMGNRLLGHIVQTMLPGQFFCYDGRYYQVRSISAENGIIVRRAADHLDGRTYYRQIREYRASLGEKVDETKDVRGIQLTTLPSEIDVSTGAYLESNVRNDLPNSDLVRLETRIDRHLYHKSVLVVELPGASAEIRFTLCVMLNELFHTIYPNECDYIMAAMADPPVSVSSKAEYETSIKAIVPQLHIDQPTEDSIYILEDSNIDLGLLVSFERNFQRLMEILADYLDWYLKRTHVNGPSSEDEDEPEETADDEGADEASDVSEGGNEVGAAADELDVMYPDTRDGDDVDGEDESLYDNARKHYRPGRYFEYLTYGYETEPDWLALPETYRYLESRRFLDSNLHRAGNPEDSFDSDSDYDPNVPGVHYCDFCGAAMAPDTYDILKDGRERCSECGKDAIRSRKQFKQVYTETITEMQDVFGIKISEGLKVRMANARKVNEGIHDYNPGPGRDPRVLGYAQGKKIVVENGAPKWDMKSTLVHELTHVWQHENWDDAYCARYGRDQSVQMTMEGMAVWTEVQYLLSMGEKERAIRYKRGRDIDTSVYGVGMKKYLEKYPPKEKHTLPTSKTPFGKFPPI